MFQVTAANIWRAPRVCAFPRAAFWRNSAVDSAGAAASAMPQPGMRIVWWAEQRPSKATTNSSSPMTNGEWVNKATGERFHQLETGPGGDGSVVVDVLAAGRREALLNLTQFAASPDQNNATSITDFNGLASAPPRAEELLVGEFGSRR